MIHRRGQEQIVLTVEPLVVTAIAPGLDVARDQVLRALHTGDPAGVLNRAHVVPEESLTTARQDERSFLGLRDRRIGIDISLDAPLPFLDVALGCRRVEGRPCFKTTSLRGTSL